MHPPDPIALVVLSEDLADLREQPLILDPTGGPLTAVALVVGRRRHPESAADELDAEAITVSIDERAHFVRPPSSSVAKNTLAARKISFALRSSETSRLSALISSRSSDVGRPGRRP